MEYDPHSLDLLVRLLKSGPLANDVINDENKWVFQYIPPLQFLTWQAAKTEHLYPASIYVPLVVTPTSLLRSEFEFVPLAWNTREGSLSKLLPPSLDQSLHDSFKGSKGD